MARIRILRESEEMPSAHRGEELSVDGATARALVERGVAERVIDRTSDVERAERR